MTVKIVNYETAETIELEDRAFELLRILIKFD